MHCAAASQKRQPHHYVHALTADKVSPVTEPALTAACSAHSYLPVLLLAVLHCDRDCLREDVHKRGACAAYKAALAIKAAQPRLSASQLEKHIASIKLTSKVGA